MKKSLIFMILVIFICSILTGCIASVSQVTINADSSIDVFIQIGVSEKTLKMAEESQVQEYGDVNELSKFTYKGNVYYGRLLNERFTDLAEFNSYINQIANDGVDLGTIRLDKNSDGSYLLTINVTSDTADTSEIKDNMIINGFSDAEIETLMKDMVVLFNFNLDDNITQMTGGKSGITINKNRLEIDYLKLEVPTEENQIMLYKFTTQKQEESEPAISNSRFTDVNPSDWYYNTIEKMAEGGLVSGVGGGRFSPDRGMKIAEFCQVLVNAMDLESGAENGYWATKAIRSCIDKGYIFSHGDITPEIYDQVITREEAIAAMQIASGRAQLPDKNIKLSDIPDGDQISEQYRDLVLQAYNSGITTGVNEQLKFSPKNQLTRAQVCQLFYNVNWTTKLN